MSKLDITIETIRAGQPRAYADSFYDYDVTVTFYPPTTFPTPRAIKWEKDCLFRNTLGMMLAKHNITYLTKSVMDKLPEHLKKKFEVFEHGSDNWHMTHAYLLEYIEPGKYRIGFKSAFTD